MLSKSVCKFLLAIFIVTHCSVLCSSQGSHVPDAGVRISQLVGNRRGRISCWGVIIQLRDSRFRRVINSNQMMIRETKHGHDIREMMTWRVTQNGRRLIVEFKPGMGDFGSGNRVEMQIDRTAFVEPMESHSNQFVCVIDTDILRNNE